MNVSSYLTTSFTHELFEPLKHFVMPFERILGIENPMILIREVEEPTGNPTPIHIGRSDHVHLSWVEEDAHCCRAWNAPMLSVSGRR